MLGRNVDDHFAKTPTPHFPRSRFDMGIHKRLQTQQHGRLYPFYCRMVYPGDTWQMDLNTFVRMDTSLRVPLDDVYLDTYWFFVPLRILDDNFPKVLGQGEPSDYDDVSYGLPQTYVNEDITFDLDCLLPYLGYNQAYVTHPSDDSSNDVPWQFFYSQSTGNDAITSYAMAAYYKIYNDWFRDENLDPSIPYKDLYNEAFDSIVTADTDGLWDNFNCLKVNKFHDYFTSGVIAPQKGPAVTIPLGTSAPVGIIPFSSYAGTNYNYVGSASTSGIAADTFGQIALGNSSGGSFTSRVGDVIADLSKAAGTINELRLSFAIQALYERRGRFGTRYIETIRGQWGIEVPDSFFLRPEYLGGSRTTLNNVPVLSTENSSQLGQMAGNSATLANSGGFTKTFIEYGIIIGLSCTRIKHSYTQGKRKELFGLKDQLDLYNPVFANIGMQPVTRSQIFNVPDDDTDTEVFNYQEAWSELRCENDTFAGLFSNYSANSEIKNKWHYGDYYASKPTFNKEWLKEPTENVNRTLTGQLIAGSTGQTATKAEQEISYGGHQYMFGYYFHPIVTRILPSHSVPVELIGRL